MGRSAVDQEPQRTPYKQTGSGCEYMVIFRCASISTGFSPVRPVIPFSIFKTFFKSFTFLKLV